MIKCPACWRWRCTECGWIRAAANCNKTDQYQFCTRCQAVTNGEILEVRHSRPDLLEMHLNSLVRRTGEVSEVARNTKLLKDLIHSLEEADQTYKGAFHKIEKTNLQRIKTTTLIRLLQELIKD